MKALYKTRFYYFLLCQDVSLEIGRILVVPKHWKWCLTNEAYNRTKEQVHKDKWPIKPDILLERTDLSSITSTQHFSFKTLQLLERSLRSEQERVHPKTMWPTQRFVYYKECNNLSKNFLQVFRQNKRKQDFIYTLKLGQEFP